jgi:precorrin-3B C17-methyltransferase
MSGRVTVVGVGPGRADWCTPAVRRRLIEATDLVGYERYLALADDVVGEPLPGRRHPSGNRVEAERARLALDLAAAGGEVVVVSSGDPGVFGMATALVEQLDADPSRWDTVQLEVEPGVTAACALASRVGAPLGHDFCVLSLSDLLKPWEVIERRLDAVAAAGFVLALYNPRSRHRPDQLRRAMEVLGRHRAPDTPVVVGRNVGRPDERITLTTLAGLDPATVDMSVLLIVGSDATRLVSRAGQVHVYTPRRHDQGRAVASDSAATDPVGSSAAEPVPPRGVWLLTGGARAGKSAYAERLAARTGLPVTVVATAEALDEEMAARIEAHRSRRPAGWATIEEPVELAAAVRTVAPGSCVVVDCVTVWVGNLFHRGVPDGEIEAAAAALAEVLRRRVGPSVVVTNEVGFGLVPETALGRRYRDVLGRVNATLAGLADRVVLMCAGRGVELAALEPVDAPTH